MYLHLQLAHRNCWCKLSAYRHYWWLWSIPHPSLIPAVLLHHIVLLVPLLFLFVIVIFFFFNFCLWRCLLLPLICLNLIRAHFASLVLSLLLFVVFCFSSWDDSSYCWCDLYCQWKSKLRSMRRKLRSLKNPPSPPCLNVSRTTWEGIWISEILPVQHWKQGFEGGAMLRVKIKDPGQASCCPSCNWQNKSHQQSPLLIFSNTSPTRRGMSSVLITFWENGKPIELQL